MKDKMRCASCGAMFKPVKSSQTKCERCERREREQRAAAKHSGAGGQKTATIAPQPVRISGPAATLLGGAANSAATQAPPPETTAYGMAAWRDEERRERERVERERREAERLEREREREKEREARSQSGVHAHPQGAHPQGPHAAPARPRPPKTERPPQPPRLPKVAKPIVPKIELTDELRAAIEARYLELARPVEFDGIRTQIATELSVPKSVIKKAVAELRKRMALPSWWELQAYTGPEAELERIRSAYIPLLPVPDVGVHKTLAEQLSMDPRAVYQGIRRIRAEMRLPQYNPPEAHGDAPASPTNPAPTATLDVAPGQG